MVVVLVCSSTALSVLALLMIAPSTSFAASSQDLASFAAGHARSFATFDPGGGAGAAEADAALRAAAATAGTIHIGPAASGEAVRILATAYSLDELTDTSTPRPIVVGPADLDVPWIVAKLEAAYEAGFAVAVTNADPFTIDRLHDLVLHEGRAHPGPAVGRVLLAAFRKVERPDGQLHYGSHLLLPRVGQETPRTIKPRPRLGATPRRLPRLFAGPQPGGDEADRSDLRGLERIFAETPELPGPPPPGQITQQNLLELAESYESHAIQTDTYGNSVQLTNTVWGARSFTDSVDLYYVLQEVDSHAVTPIISGPERADSLIQEWTNSVTSLPVLPNPTLIASSPQTTTGATQDTSSISYGIGGAVGWNEMQGLNASVSGNVTISNAKATSIPSTDIFNDTSLASGRTLWTYEVDALPQQSTTIDLPSQWIWSIPFTDYEPLQTEFQFTSTADFFAEYQAGISLSFTTDFEAQMIASVPIPFGTLFFLEHPRISNVNPSCVEPGQSFMIFGMGLYPSLVQAVLIGGMPVSQTDITTVSDQQIDVIAPDTTACSLDTGCPVAVQTAEGTSNTNVSVVIRSSCG